MVTIKINEKDLNFIKPTNNVPKYPFKECIIDLYCKECIVCLNLKGGKTDILFGNPKMIFRFIEEPDGSIVPVKDTGIEEINKLKVHTGIEAMQLVHGIINHIIMYQPQDVSVAKKRKKNGKGEKVSHKESSHVIYLKHSEHISNNDGTGQYTQPDHQVEVRGHYRHYKSGKTIWVKPYIKYKDKMSGSNKLFRLDFQ